MRNKLLFVFWLIATVGVTYVANTAVGLVDLQMFPDRTRIEVLTLSEPEDVSPDSLMPGDLSSGESKPDSNKLENFDSETFTGVTTTLPVVPTSTTIVSLDLSAGGDLEIVEIEGNLETPDSDTAENGEFTDTTTTSIPANVTTLVSPVGEESDSENSSQVVEIPTITVPVTTTLIETNEKEVQLAPLVGTAMETVDLRVGAEYQRKLITGGQAPYQNVILEGLLPDGLEVGQNGEIKGIPSKSGIFEANIQFTDTNKNSIQQPISFIVSEYRFISASGGSVTVIVTGESVRFFSALNAAGYEPAVVSRQGPLIVEVSFMPISDDQLSWVRCEVVESAVDCQSN